jgi:NitT/TauT family transport system substrate-binding protein
MAAARGAHVLADSDALGVSPGVLLFTKKALAEKRGQIAAFYRAYNGAVDEVNARPEQYRRDIVSGCGFPPAVAETMRIPKFRHAFLPPEPLVADVEAWMMKKGLVERVPAYGDIVAADFLPGNARDQ